MASLLSQKTSHFNFPTHLLFMVTSQNRRIVAITFLCTFQKVCPLSNKTEISHHPLFSVNSMEMSFGLSFWSLKIVFCLLFYLKSIWRSREMAEDSHNCFKHICFTLFYCLHPSIGELLSSLIGTSYLLFNSHLSQTGWHLVRS